MGDNAFQEAFEVALKSLLHALVSVRFRPANHAVIVVVSSIKDCLHVISSASSSNIRSEIGRLFMIPNKDREKIDDYFIRLCLPEAGGQQCLIDFIEDLSMNVERFDDMDEVIRLHAVQAVRNFGNEGAG